MRGTRVRWPILAVAAMGIALVGALIGWYFLTQRANPSSFDVGKRTNVLFVGCGETEEGSRASELAVMSLTGEGSVVFLIVPDELSIKLADGSLEELGSVYASQGVDGTRDVVGFLLGIDLHHALTCDEGGFVRIVDELGGLPLTVENDVVYVSSEPAGGERIEILLGEQVLGGMEALAYMRGESVDERPIRQQRVLRAMIERGFVDQDTRDVRSTIRDAYPFLDTELSVSALNRFGAVLGETDPDALRMLIVPTEDVFIDGVRTLQPQVVETERLVATLIRGLELLTPTEVRVAVFNGNGVRLMASRTADYLRARGFEVTRIANAESFTYPTSYVVVLTDEAKAWILRDALPSGAVSIVFPDAFEEHYEALAGLVPFGTDLLLIAGAGMEIE